MVGGGEEAQEAALALCKVDSVLKLNCWSFFSRIQTFLYFSVIFRAVQYIAVLRHVLCDNS